MKQVEGLISVALLLCLFAGSPSAQEGAPVSFPGDYIIGPGDVLEISVWRNPDLTKTVTVLPDGKIAFPLVGQVTTAARTVAQLSEELRSRLLKFVPDLDLSLAVVQVNSLIIYVIGHVKSPGRFILNSDVDVLQALAMAGGFDPFANRDKVRIYRKSHGGSKIFQFDYDDVAKGKNLSQNIRLNRGDVIIVP